MRRSISLVGLGLALMALGSLNVAHAARAIDPLTTERYLQWETSYGDLVADAVREAGLAGKAQAAVINATQFKPGTIPAGRVDADSASDLLTNSSRLWVVSTITGACLKAALERALARVPADSTHFLQVSSELKVTYDPKAAPGMRVTDLRLNGKPVRAATEYQIAMPEDLAKGGAGYFTIECFSKNTIEFGAAGTLAEALAAYIEAHPVLDYGNPDLGPGRIVQVNP